nr:MAG TPA: hypothetical protein [Caudoviricetes sp.]
MRETPSPLHGPQAVEIFIPLPSVLCYTMFVTLVGYGDNHVPAQRSPSRHSFTLLDGNSNSNCYWKFKGGTRDGKRV